MILCLLCEQTKAAEGVSQEVDRRTGEMKCRHYIDHLVYLRDSQEHPLICQQKTLLCGGVLRSIKGRGMVRPTLNIHFVKITLFDQIQAYPLYRVVTILKWFLLKPDIHLMYIQ